MSSGEPGGEGEGDASRAEKARAEVVQLLSEAGVKRLLAEAWLGHLSDIVLVIDAQLRFTYVSRVGAGESVEEVLGRSALDFVSEASRDEFVAAYRRAASSGEPHVVEAGGYDERWWQTRFVPVRGESGLMLAFAHDITERKRSELALAESERRLRDAMEVSGVGIWIWHREDNRVEWDSNVCRIFGIEPEQAPVTPAAFLEHVLPEDRAQVSATVARSRETGQLGECEYRIRRACGEVRHVFSRVASVIHAPGQASA